MDHVKNVFDDSDYFDLRFHGHGVLYFPNGGKFEAEWENGTTMGGRGAGGKYTFKDGLVHVEEEWEYCTPVDRRFYSETCNGIKPAGEELILEHILLRCGLISSYHRAYSVDRQGAFS